MSLNRVDFNPQLFIDLITQKGLRIKWEKAVNCPCVDPTTFRPVDACVVCDGRGKLYFGSSEIKGLITRQNKELEIGDSIGTLEPGEAFLTTIADNKLSYADRITNLDSIAIYHETIIHDDKYGDALRYAPVGNVEFSVTVPDRHSQPLVLQQNVDFKVNPDSTLTWLSVNKPKHNQGVSFRYVHHPVWLVTATPNLIRDTFVKDGNVVDTSTSLLLRVQLRLEHLGMGTT